MAFDWFAFSAQLLNFVLLLVLLRVFLYRPVLSIMDQRAKQLTGMWDEAEAARTEAESLKASLEQELTQLASQRNERLQAAAQEAEELLDARLQEVGAEVSASRQRQMAALEEGREKAVERLRDRSARLLVEELRASLTDLAGADLEQQAVSVFARRLQDLPEARLAELRAAARTGRPQITTAFEAGEVARQELAALLRQVLDNTEPPEFTTDKRLLFGIELTVGSLSVEVSGNRRLSGLEAAFDNALSGITADGEGPDGTG